MNFSGDPGMIFMLKEEENFEEEEEITHLFLARMSFALRVYADRDVPGNEY